MKVILIMLALMPTIAWAQPTIHNAEDFEIGTVLTFQKCKSAGIVAGNAGANQTWDFSGLSKLPETSIEWMVLPATTSHGSMFPSANLVEKYSDGSFVYVHKTKDENFLVGFVDTTKTYPPTQYPNPMTFAKRPMTYGTVIRDTFTMSGSPALGIITINPDAYGTLILPNGTHKNVLRVKISEVHPWFTFNVYV